MKNDEIIMNWWNDLSEEWKDIFTINYTLNTEIEFNIFEELIYDDYNPYSVFKKVFNRPFVSQQKIIDLDKIEFFICAQCGLTTLEPLLALRNLKAVWAYDFDNHENFVKIQRPKIEKNKLAVVFGDMDEDIFRFNGMPNFFLQFNLRIIFDHYPELNTNENLITILSQNKRIKDAFKTKIRHYLLENHTLLVLNQFSKYFSTGMSIIENPRTLVSWNELSWFRFLLATHDIGKAEAYLQNDIANQHKITIEIIEEIESELPFHNDKISLIKLILSGDLLGLYFQNKISSHDVLKYFIEKNKLISNKDLLKINMIYYQCDTASYTADAGGLKFLEHLFEYRDGEKVFDEEEGLIRFSDKYWEMYIKLKKEIDLCQ